jgi:hypothetical protein
MAKGEKMLELNENNFKEELSKHPQVLVFFYREKGCSFCDQMKPVFESHNAPYTKAKYALGASPDSITNGLVEKFPTFVAYAYGELIAKQEGVLSGLQLDNTFEPEKIPKKVLKIQEAPLHVLMADELNLIDQIYGLKRQLVDIQSEIKARRDLV